MLQHWDSEKARQLRAGWVLPLPKSITGPISNIEAVRSLAPTND